MGGRNRPGVPREGGRPMSVTLDELRCQRCGKFYQKDERNLPLCPDCAGFQSAADMMAAGPQPSAPSNRR